MASVPHGCADYKGPGGVRQGSGVEEGCAAAFCIGSRIRHICGYDNTRTDSDTIRKKLHIGKRESSFGMTTSSLFPRSFSGVARSVRFLSSMFFASAASRAGHRRHLCLVDISTSASGSNSSVPNGDDT